ncbi:hypothetical protein C3V36_06460 [Lachnospiraceae bacterium oral taxon 500]|nr:hypothetical protein C3V36_06460 [Lachnospiraceae bacterium oral taxon 500]
MSGKGRNTVKLKGGKALNSCLSAFVIRFFLSVYALDMAGVRPVFWPGGLAWRYRKEYTEYLIKTIKQPSEDSIEKPAEFGYNKSKSKNIGKLCRLGETPVRRRNQRK